jgi:alkanesulfonate monooxygenase SsuD/methylene tetrahydromethanopterin reductase-like flavin-dependent oxidoreductase (luciferase family)
MRIGLINQLHGRPDGPRPAPTWQSVSERAEAAARAGFDIFVFEDALLYRGEATTDGVWESVSIAAALAATTSGMDIAHSVLNSPYRAPGLVAKVAETLDEISGGRYVLGIGAGNTPDSDYEAFGFPTDRRYSRFAEAIHVIHGLLKEGRMDFEGEFYSVREAELVLRGPRPFGPPINIAAGGPRMLALVARYADLWNWWGWDETREEIAVRLAPIVRALEEACDEAGRDPDSLGRTFDLYTVVPEAFAGSIDPGDLPMEKPVTGSSGEIAEFILSLGELGFDEVRCDVWPKTPEAIAAMQPVVDEVHAG